MTIIREFPESEKRASEEMAKLFSELPPEKQRDLFHIGNGMKLARGIDNQQNAS